VNRGNGALEGVGKIKSIPGGYTVNPADGNKPSPSHSGSGHGRRALVALKHY